MDHIYQNIQGWFNFESAYDRIIANLPANFNFAEIGVWKGKALSYFVVSCINQNKPGTVYAIDHWLGSEEHKNKNSVHYDACTEIEDGLYATFLNNIESIKDQIKVIRKSSIEASKLFDDNFFDAIFIDASHEYKDVLEDLIHWYPKVKNNGIISGHDYDWGGVKQAVDEFVILNSYKLEVIDNHSWLLIRGRKVSTT